MALRRWQSECLDILLKKYLSGQRNCLVTATPGAGKTYLTAMLTKILFERDLIDYVICFSPSKDVANGFRVELRSLTGRKMHGLMGASGQSRTYHSLGHISKDYWDIFDDARVLVVFDEIHHCGGSDTYSCNSWGLHLLEKIDGRATYTLSLTGTPWRSDRLPMTLNKYCEILGILSCDYTYSLAEAIEDGVCRIPLITSIDNSDLLYQAPGGDNNRYSSIAELLNSGVAFQEVLENEELVTHLLERGVVQLNELRQTNPKAAGLVVATNIAHAHWLANILITNFNEEVVIVTSDDQQAQETLETFREGSQPWIVSVAMVSEGTNIPRLQVCCYLTRTRTELYFRQVLGRPIRVTKEGSRYAYFYMLAEPSLLKFAQRVNDDLPEENILVKWPDRHEHDDPLPDVGGDSPATQTNEEPPEVVSSPLAGSLTVTSPEYDEESDSNAGGGGAGGMPEPHYAGQLSVYGKFLEQLIALEREALCR